MKIPTQVLLRTASGLKKGSPVRRALLETINKRAGLDSFHTEQGRLFRIQTRDYARMLAEVLGVRGVEAGRYLRDEMFLPDRYLSYLKEYGGQYKDRIPGAPRAPRPVDINRLWDKLLEAMRKTIIPAKMDAGDFFANMPEEYEDDDFGQYVAGASGDVSQSLEYALEGKAEELYQLFMDRLRSGNYTGGGFENWSPRYRKSLLSEIYADYWHDAMMKAWAKIESNPKELERLQAFRAPRGS